jgi:hypothetical protein
MARITHPTNIHYRYPQSPTFKLTPQSQPDPQAVKGLPTILGAPENTATASQSSTLPDAFALHPYYTQAYTALTQAHRQHAQHLKSQGRQTALHLLAEGHFSKAHLMAALAKHANTPQALAGFFDALGPQNTLNALASVDPHNRDGIGPSGYAPLADPTRSHVWMGKGHLREIHSLEARHRDQVCAHRKTLARVLSKAVTGGLSDDFIQNLAITASTSTQTANQLSQVLAQSDDASLKSLKEALYNHLMTPEKALSPVSDADTRGWVRAATLLLANNPNARWIERLQDQVGSAGLSQFIATAVQGTVNITGLDGMPYGDEDYQQGLEGLLNGLSQLQGEAYTELKAHVFSAASDAMGETHTREELTEGLKALFVSDPKGIAVEIANNSNNKIHSTAAFSFFLKEAIIDNPNDEFTETLSLILKDLYQQATDSSISESENEKNSIALGVLFGNLRAAFDDAKAENAVDQDAVRNIANALAGLMTLFPVISIPLSATKDGIVVPFFDAVLNINNRAQVENMVLIDDKFYEIAEAMIAGFNGYRQHAGRNIGSVFDSAFSRSQSYSNNRLERN